MQDTMLIKAFSVKHSMIIFSHSRFNGSTTHFWPGTNVKINVLSFLNEQLSARAVCGSLRGTEPLRKGFGYFCPLKSNMGGVGRRPAPIKTHFSAVKKWRSGAAAIRRKGNYFCHPKEGWCRPPPTGYKGRALNNFPPWKSAGEVQRRYAARGF